MRRLESGLDEGIYGLCYFSEGVGYTHFVLVFEKMLKHIRLSFYVHSRQPGSKRICNHDRMKEQRGERHLLLVTPTILANTERSIRSRKKKNASLDWFLPIDLGKLSLQGISLSQSPFEVSR